MGELEDVTNAMPWLQLIRDLGYGFTVAVVLFVLALYKGVVVFGWYSRTMERERDAWREAALDGKNIVLKFVEREERRS